MKPPTPSPLRGRGLRFAIRRGWLGAALAMLAIEAILVGLLLVEAFFFSWFGSPDPARDAILATEVVRLSVASDGEHGLALVRFERGDVGRPADRLVMRYHAGGPAAGEPVPLAGSAPLEIAHSPVADLAVVGCEDGSLHLLSSAASRLEHRTAQPSKPGHLKQMVFSSDGTRLLTLDDVSINIWRLTAGGLVLDQVLSARWVCCLAVPPNPHEIVVGTTTGEIEHWALDGSRGPRRLGQCQGPILAMACAADGERVAAVDIEGTVHCCNLTSGQREWQQQPLRYPMTASVVFAGNGDRVIAGFAAPHAPQANDLFTWDAETGAVRARLEGHAGQVASLASNGSGSLLSGDLSGSLRRWDLRSCAETWELTVPALDLLDRQQALEQTVPSNPPRPSRAARRSRR